MDYYQNTSFRPESCRHTIPPPEPFLTDSFIIRRAELDDCEKLQILLKKTQLKRQENAINFLYDYPNEVTLVEKCYLSVTILNSERQVVGMAIFNDFPQGLKGMIDFQHENFWENWLGLAYDYKFDINSFNSIWMIYFCLAKEFLKLSEREETNLSQKIFQHVYGSLPHLQHLLFLYRGEAANLEETKDETNLFLSNLFQEIDVIDQNQLKKVQGIHWDSRLYISLRNSCCDELEIRMAREEDHDDLAEVFNAQSEVLTEQFGEFFIADLIANQNQTRRNTEKIKSDGKALVGEVNNKAIGLMSLSSDIDYKLLANSFELETYDNLFKPDFMNAIRDRRTEIQQELEWQAELKKIERLKQLKQESMQCKWKGQRICFQQWILAKENEIKQQLESFITNKEQAKTLTRPIVEKMIDSWVLGFHYNQPSALFLESECKDPELLCIIQSNRQFFLETLTFFGLPKNYIQGEGHWKDWEEKILSEQRAQSLKRPVKKKTKNVRGKKKDEEEKKDELKPPSYFDLSPFQAAFSRFVATTAEQRALFIKEIENNYKKVITLFTFEDGVMNEARCVDLNTMGAKLGQKGVVLPPVMNENISSILECFGDAIPEENIIKVIPEPKEEPALLKGKAVGKEALKKMAELQEAPKPIDVLQKMVSYREFMDAFKTMKEYDLMMARLGHIVSETLNEQVSIVVKQEQMELKIQEQKRLKLRVAPEYQELVGQINDLESLPPNIPFEAQNAIVINLFCIDLNYESQSGDFLKYAFRLFPDREYIVLTQPHTIAENTLLQQFVQVQKKQTTDFDHVLYIIHKDALAINSIIVRRSVYGDIFDFKPFLYDLKDKESIEKDMIEGIKDLSSKKIVFSIFCEGVIIGMYVLSKNVNLDYYASHFCIQDHIVLSEHPKDSHTRLLHAILNPLFSKYTRFILKEILRLTNKTCLYFETHEKTLLPDIFQELHMVRARVFPHLLKRKWDFQHDKEFFEKMGDKSDIQDGERNAFDQEESMFALSMVIKKNLSVPLFSNNTRIVVVGASDTGISFIESLLTIKDVKFTYITLLAPGGLLTMNVQDYPDLLKAISTNYTFQEIKNLMLDARVNVLDTKMVSLDKKGKRIGLDKNVTLPYDLLICTVGLIDTQLQNMVDPQTRQISPLISTGVYQSSNYEGYLDKKCKLGVYSIDDPYLYAHFRPTGRKEGNIELLKRKKKPQNCVVYGRTLNTIAFINGLLNKGVEGNRISYVIPPRSYTKKSKFASNQELAEYVDLEISDPDSFDDELIHEKIINLLRSKGVTIFQEYTIEDVLTDAKNITNAILIKRRRTKEELDRLLQKQQEEINEGSAPEEGITIEEDEFLEINARFMITSGIIDIDREIFNVIHENGLVYNGRLIIKSNFQTTESVVFACGRICEFSQRYKNQAAGVSLRLDKYNGRELGQKLAQSVLSSLDLTHLFDCPQISEDQLPSFYMPIGISAFLPGNFIYYNIRKNDYFRPKKTLNAEKNRTDVVSDNIVDDKGNYLKFSFDNNGLIENISYLGTTFVSVSSLINFIGLSESYLNQLKKRKNDGLIPDVTEFLSENWSIALYHEWFSGFRHIIKNQLFENSKIKQILEVVEQQARDGRFLDEKYIEELKKKVPKDIIQEIKNGTVEFIRKNQNHLPMYYVPHVRNGK